VARLIVPGDPVPAGLDAADRAVWVRAVGVTVPALGLADVLPGDAVEVPDHAVAEFTARGWVPAVAAVEVAGLTVAELRALAADLGVELPDRAPKAELVAALEHATRSTDTATPEEQ
jgi:hypothetical protein